MSSALSELARRFPALREAEGVEPFDADRLDAWACAAPPAGLNAARFVLRLHGGVDATWRCGRFDALTALATWGPADRAVFAAWAIKPVWPTR